MGRAYTRRRKRAGQIKKVPMVQNICLHVNRQKNRRPRGVGSAAFIFVSPILRSVAFTLALGIQLGLKLGLPLALIILSEAVLVHHVLADLEFSRCQFAH